MKTKRITIKNILENFQGVEKAATILRSGGVVAIPTETVYGLAVKYDNPKAIEKLIQIKDRSVGSGKVFALMTADVYGLSDFAELSDLAEQIAAQG